MWINAQYMCINPICCDIFNAICSRISIRIIEKQLRYSTQMEYLNEGNWPIILQNDNRQILNARILCADECVRVHVCVCNGDDSIRVNSVDSWSTLKSTNNEMLWKRTALHLYEAEHIDLILIFIECCGIFSSSQLIFNVLGRMI